MTSSKTDLIFIGITIMPLGTPQVLRSSSQGLLSKVRTSTAYGRRSFAAAAPELWNDIPMSLKTADSISSFKSQLKTYLFRAKL